MDEELPDFEMQVLFAEGGAGELRQVPLNIGNRLTVLFEMTEDRQVLTFAGIPDPTEDESLHEILTGLLEYLYETVKNDVTADMLEKENNDCLE